MLDELVDDRMIRFSGAGVGSFVFTYLECRILVALTYLEVFDISLLLRCNGFICLCRFRLCFRLAIG